ncbi:hypothetical protein P9112_011160 [Eukaryota sp. TZLM1-RC]
MPLPSNVTREFTINLHKRVFGTQFKKRAPKALKEIKKFVARYMNTEDVRVDPAVNKFCWVKGIRSPPNRIRVRCMRRESEEEPGKLFTRVVLVEVNTFKGLSNQTIVE